ATGTAPASGPASGPASAPAKPASDIPDFSKVVTGVYLEGDITLDQGDKISVHAERMYFDFTSQRAVMLDATLATVDEIRSVPLYMRAAEIRQLARGEFAAKKVEFSTSEFYTPHYHIGASEVYLRDISPQTGGNGSGGGGAGGSGESGSDVGFSGDISAKTFQFQVKDATLNVEGTPIFYWPFLGGDTSKNEIPLRTLRVSNSKTYGLTLLTDWDLFGLMGQPEPQGIRADLNLDYFGKRGPAGGVQSSWLTDTDHGVLRSYALLDQGTDRLGKDRSDVNPEQEGRGRITVRDQHDLGDGWTLQLEGSYISDPTFLEQFFQHEFDTDKEHETAAYLKKQGQTDQISLLVSANAMDFTSTADQVDDQFMTEKLPELKYWRIGDSFLDMFTYYSENSLAEVQSSITDFSPVDLHLQPQFVGLPAGGVPVPQAPTPQQTYRHYYQSLGWTTGSVLRADTRHELDMPLQVGDAKITPYVTGRLTFWDDGFADENQDNTTRVVGGGGIRASMQFWRVYSNAESRFFDVHELRHIIEPQFNLFVQGSSQDRRDLQPFDRAVEGITNASGTQLSLNQKWQTKRGGEGHWRDVDWIVFNVAWNQFWNKDDTGLFFPARPLRGFYFASRPELSLATSSIDADATWRVGERMRLLGDANYSLDTHRVEQAAAGLAVDQSNTLSYFIGNRYVNALNTDQWTLAMDYQLTQKYRLIASESFDTQAGHNILTSMTLIRRMPRLNAALTVTYDANQADTSVVFTMWPEGLPGSSQPMYMGDRR
ncbi:MAG TPA: LPS assembly protein LptD, partial [Phycisphaerae bacterium]|nr:LPS assembly protein LptD [Phycisphaerae bacterium]